MAYFFEENDEDDEENEEKKETEKDESYRGWLLSDDEKEKRYNEFMNKAKQFANQIEHQSGIICSLIHQYAPIASITFKSHFNLDRDNKTFIDYKCIVDTVEYLSFKVILEKDSPAVTWRDCPQDTNATFRGASPLELTNTNGSTFQDSIRTHLKEHIVERNIMRLRSTYRNQVKASKDKTINKPTVFTVTFKKGILSFTNSCSITISNESVHLATIQCKKERAETFDTIDPLISVLKSKLQLPALASFFELDHRLDLLLQN